MKPEHKDLLLSRASVAAAAAILVLAFIFRQERWLLWVALALVAPNLLPFYTVPFLPVPMSTAADMLKAAGLKRGETVYDLGCGDGRLVYLAVKDYGVTGIGLELSPVVYLIARIRGVLWGSGAAIKFGDMRLRDLSGADAVFCYLNTDMMRSLEPKLLRELKPGARVVSCVFKFPNWKESRSAVSGNNRIWIYEKPEASAAGPDQA